MLTGSALASAVRRTHEVPAEFGGCVMLSWKTRPIRMAPSGRPHVVLHPERFIGVIVDAGAGELPILTRSRCARLDFS